MNSRDKAIDASLLFLRRWYGDDARVLTAIDPDEGYIRTRGFAADDEAGARRFIEKWRPSRGLYFQVNPDLRAPSDIQSKGRKEHIARAGTLHADIDTYKVDEDRAVTRQCTMCMLTEVLPDNVPGLPSVIIDSGNGIHAYWRLRTPFELNGDVAKAEEVERRNRGLAHAFGGDATTDVSRILRLPGSINWPNASKRARGLVPVLARQVLFEPGRLYDLSEFPTVEHVGARYVSERHERLASSVVVGDPAPVASLDVLRVPDRTRALIAVPVPPGQRSQRLRSAVLSMIACGESNETILGVVTDPRWAISESVIEKDDPDGYARRQIARAHAWLSAQREGALDDE